MVQGLLLASSANLLVGRAATAADIPSPSALPRTDMPSIEVHDLHDLMYLAYPGAQSSLPRAA